MDDDNIIYLFGEDELDNELFRQILDELIAHMKDGRDYDKVFRNYISIAATAWIAKDGYAKVRENLFGLIVALDKNSEFNYVSSHDLWTPD